MLVVAISVMLCVVVVLVTMHCLAYIMKPTCQTAASKELAHKVGICVREVEGCLEADVFLDKYPWWEPGGLHHPFLLQWMFTHIEATG